jgi:hypothetical protein
MKTIEFFRVGMIFLKTISLIVRAGLSCKINASTKRKEKLCSPSSVALSDVIS